MRITRSLMGLIVGVVCLLVSGARGAPSISYPTFLLNAPFQLNGAAQGVMAGNLLLTAGNNLDSSIFVNTPQDVTQSFIVQYTFTIGPGYSVSGSGPAGLAFVIQNDPRGATGLGGGDAQIGYGDGQANSGKAILGSLALSYSAYGNANNDEFQLIRNLNSMNLDARTSALATQSGNESLVNAANNPQQMQITYTAPNITYANGAVTVLLNGNSIGLDNVALPASLQSIVGSNTAYFGFTASSGASAPAVYVESLTAGPVPEPTLTTGVMVLAGAAALRRRRGQLNIS